MFKFPPFVPSLSASKLPVSVSLLATSISLLLWQAMHEVMFEDAFEVFIPVPLMKCSLTMAALKAPAFLPPARWQSVQM